MKIVGYVVVGSIIVGLLLAIWWFFWALWTWVLPQIWPTGPETLIRPGYWLFVGCLLLLGFIGKLLFKADK